MGFLVGRTVTEMASNRINRIDDKRAEHDDKYLSKSWQSALVTLVLLFIIGFFTMQTIGKSPAKPIYIMSSNLNAFERQSLTGVVLPLGDFPFFGGNLHQIHDELMKLSWVEYAKVKRDWHRGIVVEVVPRKPIANFGSQDLLDANGVVFKPANTSELMNEDLVTVHGSVAHVNAIMHKMRYVNERFAPLGLTVNDLILTSRNTWIIRFHNGLRVVVDDENTEQKLYYLAVVLKERFANRIHEMQSVDLRYKNGFSIAWQDKR
jgi:cell division protein ftsQ